MAEIRSDRQLDERIRRELQRQHRVTTFKRRARKIGITLAVVLIIAVPSTLFFGNKILHPPQTLEVAFSPNGRLLASGSTGHTIKLWNVQSGTLLRTLPIATENFRDRFVPFAFSPDSQILACIASLKPANPNDTPVGIQLWDVQSGRLLWTLQRASLAEEFTSLAFSPDGHTLAFGINSVDKSAGPTWSGSVELWDAQSGREVRSIDQWNVANELAFSSDGRTLAVASEAEGTNYAPVVILDVASGQRLKELDMDGILSSMALSPDGRTLTTAVWFDPNAQLNSEPGEGGYTSVTLWDVSSGKSIRTLLKLAKAAFPQELPSVAFSPDGRTLASGSGEVTLQLWTDETIKLWDVHSGREVRTLSG